MRSPGATSAREPVRVARDSTARRWSPALLGLAALVAALSGHPLLWAALTTVLLAAALASTWRAVVGLLPAAAVLLVAASTLVGLAANRLPLLSLTQTWPARALLAASGLVALALSLRSRALRPQEPTAAWRPRSWRSAAWVLPGALMGGLGVVPSLDRQGALTGWFNGGDHLRHLMITAGLTHTGAIQYQVMPYPRGWHQMLALWWTSVGTGVDGPGFVALTRLEATASWLTVALLALVVASTAKILAQRSGGSTGTAAVAGVVAGAAVLGPAFGADYLALGFETAVLATLALAVCGREVLVDHNGWRSVLVAAASFVVVANSWQLLIAPAAWALAVTLLRQHRRSPSRRTVAIAVGVLAVTALASVEAALAVFADVGLSHAAVGGDVSALPWPWLVAGVVGVGVVLLRLRSSVAHSVMVALVPAATGLAIALVERVSLSSYYPNKTLWAATVLLLPFGAAALAIGGARAEATTGRSRLLLVPVGALAVGVVLLGVVSPFAGLAGAWSAVDGRTVRAALTSPGVDTVEVVWTGQRGALDPTLKTLLGFYHGGDARTTSPLPSGHVSDQCLLLTSATTPTVLSDLSSQEVQRRYACAPGIRVIPIQGP
ncbi:hypothetical protein [Pedococcus bigeumensis]|uniref:hypothetical protein n=1 Tax=Pedococcus bigeumensis TaxID=433644 RepID=UPI002FE88916